MEQLDISYMRELLATLREFGAGYFKCKEFSIAFGSGEIEEEEDPEPVSTDVRGFVAGKPDDDDDDDDLDSPASMHRRAFGGVMPKLAPKRPG